MDAPCEAQGTLSARIRALIDQGCAEDARGLLKSRPGDDGIPSDEHTRLGDLAEELGETGLAIAEFNLALREDRNRPGIIVRIARLRTDRGEIDRAVRAYRKCLALSPEDESLRREAIDCVVAFGRPDLVALFDSASSDGTDVDGAARSIPRILAPPAPSDSEFAPSKGEPVLDPTDSACLAFCARFAGREGVHARQWSSATGRGGYSPVREPFTAAVARMHLLGAVTVGIYPVRLDGTVLFLAFDLDMTASGPIPVRGDRSFDARLRRVHESALSIVDACASMGLPSLLEDSGHKGRHVWVLFESPVPAAAARRLAQAVLSRVGPLPPEVSVEVFPKQSRVAEGGLGNLIKIPLGVHRLTGRRGWLLDPASGQPWPRPLESIEQAARVPRSALAELLAREEGSPRVRTDPPCLRLVEDEEAAGAEADDESPVPPSVAVPERAEPVPSPLPEALPYDIDQDVEALTLMQRCPVLAEIVRRVREGGVLSTDERLVLTHTLGHLQHGPEAVNALMSATLNADPTSFLKSRLRGHPVSCPRIRLRLKDLTAAVSCDCRFDETGGMYPTPILHLSELRLSGRYGTDPARVTRMQVERLLSDLSRARSQAERAQQMARQAESRIREILEAQSLTELQTEHGCVRQRDGALVLELAPG